MPEYKYTPTTLMLPTSHYDKRRADYAVDFIQNNLYHTAGKWLGQPFKLLNWQETIIRDIFGIVNEDGFRQFRTAYVEIGKKNGKSELASAIALYLLFADKEPAAEVYVKATVQAVIDVFGEPEQESGNNSGFTEIVGKAVANIDQMRAYLTRMNPNAPDIASIYIAEGESEGIRGDIAFAQSCLETGFFKFSGGTTVTFEQNNFCGMGVTTAGARGNSYASVRDGIRAQIQHLKAYANDVPLVNPLVAPTVGESRFKFVVRGCAPYVEWLGQKENPQGRGWAVGAGYGGKILQILRDIVGAGGDVSKPPTTSEFVPYRVRVTTDALNIRESPGTGNKSVGKIKDRGVYTIVGEANATGAKRWGKLKSEVGWISLDWTERV